jgi:predicted dehydrogenase
MNSKIDKVKWGIIGCGDVTEVKSGPGFQNADHSELVAVMRRNAALAEDYAIRHNVPKWYNNTSDLINDPDVNAIYVATPPSTHMTYTIEAANAGKPVYVEKPMAMNYEECLKMIKACEKANVPLYVAYYRRALPKYLKVKSILDEGQIGIVRLVNIQLLQSPSLKDQDLNNWRVNSEIAGCGYFCDLGSHMIDLLQYFLGPIKSAHGYFSNQSKRYEAEDIVTANFIFKNDILGFGAWAFNTNQNIDRTEIIGSEGKISYSTFGDEPILLEKNGIEESYHIKNPIHIQQPLIKKIVNELLGNDKSPSTGKTGAETNLVIDKILI